MKLTLLSQQEFTSISLPEKCAGRYVLRARNAAGRLSEVVAVEAVRSADSGQPQWVLKSNRRFTLVDAERKPLSSAVLRPLALHRIESTEGGAGPVSYVLYTEPLTGDRRRYRGYELAEQSAVLTIGRSPDCSIVYTSDFASRRHAELTISPGRITLRDTDSANGTYVNGQAVRQRTLQVGDTVYIMGLQIVVTPRRLFLNNPDGKVQVNSAALRPCRLPAAPPVPSYDEEDEDCGGNEEEFYYRAPRFKRDAADFTLKLDAPPANQDKDDVPMILLIGPSMTMGMASMATGIYAVTNAISRGDISSAIPSIVMSLSMLLGTLMWPLITKTYQRRLRRRREQRRQETYQAYLDKMEGLVARETSLQEELLRENDPDCAACAAQVLSPAPRIWERTEKHSDFLSLRLGCGDLPLRADIQYPERRFTVEEDNLTEAMYRFGERERLVRNVPVCLPLRERFVSGVYAPREERFALAKSLILQIAARHSYDEVKLAVIYDESDGADFSFVRWLPHTMDNGRTVRYLATNADEAKVLSASLSAVFEYRRGLSESRLSDELPYFVILCLDKALAAKTECVRRIQEHKENLKFSVVSLFPRLQDLPKECAAVAAVQGGQGSLTFISAVSEPPVLFRTDGTQAPDMARITAVLANTFVDLSGSAFTLPRKYTFLEMLGVGAVEHLNLAESWAASDPTKSLAAAVGVDRYGEPFQLDLHERAHGPHGLVAGMTGSGKSEFIISYILSMAIHFHPYEVAFILIDYKGGGMAKAFESIPHTAGVITNLDGNGIQRSLASMRSELHRRERLFREVSKQHSISNIDIYKYQKLYREGKVTEPLPHLLIISDEFAELKKEQSEFMTELTSTARVGRSLGVHLILATQKPGGVVDDQIRSNSRFRVCLKVQDNSDSMEMLGRPEAAALVDTGRFYLQVGNNEIFELGQSAWAGAPYYPAARVLRDRDDAVSVIDTNGRVIAEANVDRFAAVKDPPKQLDVLTEYIRAFSEGEGIRRWKMWLDPIPARIDLDQVTEKYAAAESSPFSLAPVVGEYDDPGHQAQGVLRVPITEGGNVIVYGAAGSGKEMFIEAMCCSLLKHHSPREVSLYLLDFGAETLTSFADAPHVGEVILSYETEKVQNLFKLLLGRLQTRKKLLSRFGGDLLQYNVQAKQPEPSLVVVIHNYAAFTELFEERGADINYLTREGTKYGIYFVLTCTGVNNVRLNLLQNFRNIYCLQLNNADDYASVVGKTGGLLPEKHRGRGLVRLDKDSLFEFQTASVTSQSPPQGWIRAFAKDLAGQYAGVSAAAVPVLPERVTEQFLAPYVAAGDLSRLPVGVEKETLDVAYWNFTERPVHLVLSVNREWQGLADAVGALAAGRCGVKTMLLAAKGTAFAPAQTGTLSLYTDAPGCVGAVREIFDTVLRRNNAYKDALAAGEAAPRFEPLLVVIESLADLKAALTLPAADGGEKTADDDTPLNRLQLAMEKCDRAYGVYFLVAESLGALTPFTAESWYKAQVDGSSGIWVGSGISGQYRLTVSRKPQDASAELGADFGYLVRRAAAVQVKFIQ